MSNIIINQFDGSSYQQQKTLSYQSDNALLANNSDKLDGYHAENFLSVDSQLTEKQLNTCLGTKVSIGLPNYDFSIGVQDRYIDLYNVPLLCVFSQGKWRYCGAPGQPSTNWYCIIDSPLRVSVGSYFTATATENCYILYEQMEVVDDIYYLNPKIYKLAPNTYVYGSQGTPNWTRLQLRGQQFFYYYYGNPRQTDYNGVFPNKVETKTINQKGQDVWESESTCFINSYKIIDKI